MPVYYNAYSNGPAANGNDYVVDDFALNMINVSNFVNMSKDVNTNFTPVPSTVTYTVTIANTSATQVTKFIFSDTLPTGTSFIANTLAINNSIVNGVSPALPGFDLGPLAPFSTNTVTFSVLVTTTPSTNYIENSASPTYVFSAISNGVTIANNVLSNTVTTFVGTPIVYINKSIDKPFSACGVTIIYTINIKNSGNIPILNCFFVDTLSNSMTFIPNSVYLNNSLVSGVTPNPGFNIGDIPAGGTSTITFQSMVSC